MKLDTKFEDTNQVLRFGRSGSKKMFQLDRGSPSEGGTPALYESDFTSDVDGWAAGTYGVVTLASPGLRLSQPAYYGFSARSPLVSATALTSVTFDLKSVNTIPEETEVILYCYDAGDLVNEMGYLPSPATIIAPVPLSYTPYSLDLTGGLPVGTVAIRLYIYANIPEFGDGELEVKNVVIEGTA